MDEPLGLAVALEEETSLAYLKQWDRLVSSTNWEKGRIIHEWRTALVASQAAATQYSDEAWSRRRQRQRAARRALRRVFERFGAVNNSYPDLYWSHFQAALDWNDAEMWLEGAVQNGWSVSQMRLSSRWLAMGAPDELRPSESDVISAELDEDFSADRQATGEIVEPAERAQGAFEGTTGPDYNEGPDFGDEPSNATAVGVPFDADAAMYPGDASGPAVRPFENLAELPPDLAEAFENFKLTILRHKVAGWTDVSRDDVLAVLDALRHFACAPS